MITNVNCGCQRVAVNNDKTMSFGIIRRNF